MIENLTEALEPLLALFANDVVATLVMVLFVVLLFVLAQVVRRFQNNEQLSGLANMWKLVDDVIYDAIIETALSPETVSVAQERVDHIHETLGHEVDIRMAAVLVHIENYVENYIPMDIDLVFLYHRAERIYQESREQL